ncbi:MAG: hypothetical protein D9C04_06300 [Nitrosopumilus sp. B06]|nr:MAG: hypothetical protein D9C04_06300 [Nitrosopumilus sp. B06]
MAGILVFTQYEEPPTKFYSNDFTYSDIDVMRDALAFRDLRLSAITEIADHTVGQYCTYFDADGRQRPVSYCITTALVDSEDTVGNINMGGNKGGKAAMAVALVESSSIDSTRAEYVFEVMIDALVCECWQDVRPGGFASVQEWMAEAQEQFSGSTQSVPLKSRISGLDQKDLVLEISQTDGLYLWVLVVAK